MGPTIVNPLGILGSGSKHRTVSDVLRDNGWPDAAIPTAVKIIWGESGGDPTSQNTHNTNGTWDTGLMQINDIHAGRAGSPKEKNAFREWLKNPDNNARLGLELYRGRNGFGDWMVFNNGKFRRAPGGWDAAVDQKEGGGIIGAAQKAGGGVAAPFEAAVKVVEALFDPSTYFRLGKGLLGGVILMTGVVALAIIALKDPAKKAVGVAEAVAPVGKIGKVVKKL